MSDDQNFGPPWTILKLLRWTTGYFENRQIESARLEAELLLSHVLDVERIHLYTAFDQPLAEDELAEFRALVQRRADHEPCAYILGHREFWSLDLKVDQRVLIPRPDTETLVRASLERIDADSSARLVDIGTGSGALALAIASERPTVDVAATDLSSDALDVARHNAACLDMEDRISFFEGDLLDALPQDWMPLDFIVSNPPYIAEDERDAMAPEITEYEPVSALMAGPEGLDVITELIEQSVDVLAPGGHLLIEIGHRQGEAVEALLDDADFTQIEIIADYGDRDRVAAAQKPPQ